MSEFPYEESYGPAYNYEVGYLEGLRQSLQWIAYVQSMTHITATSMKQGLMQFFKEKIEEQKESVKEAMPDE